MKKLALGLLLSITWMFSANAAEDELDKQCVPEGKWVSKDNRQIENSDIIKTLSNTSVVLIGEDHENPEHHRMQLHTMTQLYAQQPNMALGFESFPRSTQKSLDQWVNGELSEDDFIKAVRWDEVWRFNKDYYLPMFHFARMNKIPMIALNVERKLVSTVSNKGWDNVDESMREGVSKPKPASKNYMHVLAEVFAQHMPKHAHESESGQAQEVSEEDLNAIIENPSFQKFMQGQLVWDRAMAEAIAKSLKEEKVSLVVSVMGAGHVMGDYGVVHQLKDLGVNKTATLMPWDGSVDCSELKSGAFDYAFGVKYFESKGSHKKDHPRLGVYLEHVDGVVISRIVPGSVAESMGINVGDKIIQIAGKPVEKVMDVVETVKITAFGTWLPLLIERDGEKKEFVAKFSAK